MALAWKKSGSSYRQMPITHAIYLVSDTDKAIEFLSGTFDFIVKADDVTITGDRFLTMGEPHTEGLELQIIKVSQQSVIADKKREAGVVDFIFETTDIAEMIRCVEQQELTIHRRPIEAEYGWTAIFEDPFGNLWDLVQRP